MRMVTAVAVVLASLTMAVIPHGASASVPAVSKTVVYGFGTFRNEVGWGHPEVRPAGAIFSLAGEDGIKGIRWHVWGRSSASGQGLHLLFTGTGFRNQKATIVLSDVRTHRGQRYFSHLVMRWTTRNGKHHTETLNWRLDKGVGWLWIGNYQ